MAAQPTPLRPALTTAEQRAPIVVPLREGPPSVLKWTLALPLIVVAAIVTIYGLGAIWKWGQVRDAGLIAADALPLVPRDQLVTLGTELVAFTATGLPLTLALTLLLHLALPDGGRAWGIPRGLALLTLEHERLRRDLDELRADAGADELVAKRVRRLRTRADRVRARLTHRTLLVRLVLAAGVLALVVVNTPARIAVALFGLWTLRRVGGGVARVAATVFAALLLVVVAERFTAPQPLPDATIRTTTGTLVKGPLVAATPDAWYVVVAERRVKAVPAANVAKSSIASPVHDADGALNARLLDLLRR